MTHYPSLHAHSTFDAVIIAAGDFPTHPLPLALLYNARYRCCCDGAAAELTQRGIEPHAIVGDGDSLTAELKARYKDILHIVHEQDDNDLTKATRHCISLGFERILYLACTGKREDHTLGNIALMHRYRHTFGIHPVLLTNHGCFLPANGHSTFDTYTGQQVSIFNIDATHLTGTGFRWAPYPYTEPWQGTLNEALGSSVTLTANGHYLLFLAY